MGTGQTVLWWGRGDNAYSRNRNMQALLRALGYDIVEFRPASGPTSGFEAARAVRQRIDLVWVPCFRQRDVRGASRYARKHGLPLVFDPLISTYDKQVFEREKFPGHGWRGRRLHRWEAASFARADRIVADTPAHAEFFVQEFRVPADRLFVVPVGADESLFHPGAGVNPSGISKDVTKPPEILFYGSFLSLQGPDVIADAVLAYTGPEVRWTLLGSGPLLDRCKHALGGRESVHFEPWIDYAALPARILRADIVLGVFGTSAKAGRVVPNKVFQALACGKPLITRSAPAYPESLSNDESAGIVWVRAGDPQALANAVDRLAGDPSRLRGVGTQARATYDRYYSLSALREDLRRGLCSL